VGNIALKRNPCIWIDGASRASHEQLACLTRSMEDRAWAGHCEHSTLMRNNPMMKWPLWALFLLLPACRDDGSGSSDGGGTDGGGGTGGDSSDGADGESGPEEPDPDLHGDQCGGDVLGWETVCLIESVVGEANDRGEIPGLPPEGGSTVRKLCCEGQPSVEEADAGCQGYCILETCEAALLDHLDRCESCALPNCGFDMTDCLDSGVHDQLVACLAPAQFPFYYTLTTSCSAINNELRHPDGTFDFLEDPNITGNDPKICGASENLEHEPPRGLGQFKASASDGTLARLTWSMADMSGEERSEELDVVFEYGIVPCATASADCMELTALELTLPTTSALGMTITKARLSAVSVEEAPMIERGEAFHFSEGAIRVLMQAYVDGLPLVLTGTNVGSPSGRLSPAGDQFSISGLRFEYADSVVDAALEVDIQGQYDARRPTAQITRMAAPERCGEPVTLLATSWDADQDALTHTWWVRGIGSFSGPLLELPLPAGEHTVMLTSGDTSGLFDSETLRYARTCR